MMRRVQIPSLQRSLLTRPQRGVRFLRRRALDDARSDLVLQETALFLYQLQYDSRMQQAMLFDSFDVAQKLRAQRDEVDALLEKFQTEKGPMSGATPLSMEFMDLTTTGLQLRNALSQAVDEERYEDAARLRDELAQLNERVASATNPVAPSPASLQLRLGQLVRHVNLDYQGVICGWDLGCCETQPWKERIDVSSLRQGEQQPFYHVLVDERDWPAYTKGPPVAYVAQELLEEVKELTRRDFEQIQHPFLFSMFLGRDNQGAYIPCTPLRNKYKVEREDSHPPDEDEKNDN